MKKATLGSTEFVNIAGYHDIPAKIDTGADSSSIWASHIHVDQNNILTFQLFDKKSPFYTGETIERKEFKAVVVRSASGEEQIRYRTNLQLTIGGRKINAMFTLANRGNNNFPVLIGRRTLSGKFLIDVSKNHSRIRPKNSKTKLIQKLIEKNPREFHELYYKKYAKDVNKIKIKKGASL